LRWKIRQEAGVYGGMFTSRYLEEPGRPALYNQYSQAYFLGSDGLTIWNAIIITTAREFWNEVGDMAFNRAWDMLTPEEQAAEGEIKFDPIWSKGQKYFQMRERPRVEYEKFGGLTYHDYKERLNEEIIQLEPPEVYESFTTDRTYQYGIGLNVVIHADEINLNTIEKAIQRFREIGETDWRAADPVPRDELPQESANVAFCKVQWEPADS
jgi:hypothetical protein